ncbi:enoyl-CoA hydratase/isomerase [Diaporthe helianthi]|uniref:Enoyl-CoA hydratase/isomerase n=1 Tax=Diaporthe helianthi TaxID=158607 RepID=A0A2P5IDE0_DIAHE|nr:enoyl-CoA hydratase/isomerase [Diaporthe helianthi]
MMNMPGSVMQDIVHLSTEHLKVLVDDDGVAVVQLNRPQKRNAFTQAMIDSMVAALADLDARKDIRALVVTGSPGGGPFCGKAAGMDLKELIQISTADAHRRAFLKDLTDAFARFSKPSVAAVTGFAVSTTCMKSALPTKLDNLTGEQLGGGCELALACDIIYAEEDAKFGLPEITIGTIPGAGGTQRFARALGKYRAMELILTGDSVPATELQRLGLVNKVFPKDHVQEEAIKVARRIAALSAAVVASAKQAVLTAENSHLEAGMAHEKALYYATFSTHDCKEGLSAFLEKRAPRFEHR